MEKVAGRRAFMVDVCWHTPHAQHNTPTAAQYRLVKFVQVSHKNSLSPSLIAKLRCVSICVSVLCVCVYVCVCDMCVLVVILSGVVVRKGRTWLGACDVRMRVCGVCVRCMCVVYVCVCVCV